MEPAFALATLLIAGLFGLRVYRQYIKESEQEKGNDLAHLALKDVREVMAEAPEVLGERIPYFNGLSELGKARFLARLQVILANKDFIAMEGLKVTNEMIVLCAAGLVQITFGLESFELPRFKRFYIYPDKFFNQMLEAMLKGSASPNGAIRLSWKHLHHGFEIADDGINLTLHELAHALKVSIEKEDNDVDKHLFQSLQVFLDQGEPIRSALLQGKIDVLRRYAAVNEHEFFACCVEHFFETPTEFKKEMPRLYASLCELLQQDPTNTEHDYASMLDKRTKGYLERARNTVLPKPERKYNYVQAMILIGFFIGIYVFAFSLHDVISSKLAIFLYLASFFAIGVVVFYRRLLVSGYTIMGIFIVFLLLGWLPIVGSIGLWVNYLIPIYHQTEVFHARSVGLERYHIKLGYGQSVPKQIKKGPAVSVQFFEESREENYQFITYMHSYYGLLGLNCYDSHEVFVVQGNDTIKLK